MGNVDLGDHASEFKSLFKSFFIVPKFDIDDVCACALLKLPCKW
jgi:hypothetical protein